MQLTLAARRERAKHFRLLMQSCKNFQEQREEREERETRRVEIGEKIN